jgi:hypothetical protein
MFSLFVKEEEKLRRKNLCKKNSEKIPYQDRFCIHESLLKSGGVVIKKTKVN